MTKYDVAFYRMELYIYTTVEAESEEQAAEIVKVQAQNQGFDTDSEEYHIETVEA